ncbi:putative mannose-1-phosphate guanylyltransferase 2 [Cucumispora dikerogammari]|nr:putative mannose-1-phosphate guanylyltransferase 2 [Cucumispora dikerogammari]
MLDFKKPTGLDAIILSGGLGTRMRPLTFTTPKPLLKLLSIPLMDYLIHKLVELKRISKIILAISNNSTMNDMLQYSIEASERFNIKIICSIENQQLGTAGSIKNAEHLITTTNFIVMNADIIFSSSLTGLINEHFSQSNLGTILATEVEDPSRFGVLKTEKRKIIKFFEKPKIEVGKIINAGIYILNKQILANMELRDMSIEKEVFPVLANRSKLGYYIIKGFWKDVGQPIDYFEAQNYLINNPDKFNIPHMKERIQCQNNIKYFLYPNVLLNKAIIKENVSIGKGCFVGEMVVLENCTLMENTVVKKGAVIKNTILGKGCVVESDSELNGCLIGDNVRITGKQIEVVVCPNKCVETNNKERVIL